MRHLIFSTFIFLTSFASFGQHIGSTFKDMEIKGINIDSFNRIYKSAFDNVDTSQGVFKTESEKQDIIQAYYKMLQDFKNFLVDNNFKLDKATKCYNKIYFNSDGTVDYFLYNFIKKNVKIEDQLSTAKQIEFNRLLNLFIKNYKLPMTAKTKFSQCGTTTYSPTIDKDNQNK